MTIAENLKRLAAARGGDGVGIVTIADGVKRLAKIDEDANELSGLVVDADIADSVDLLGKTASDLQTGVTVKGGRIAGTLKYVTGYTGFSGLEEEQSGNYLALHAYIPDIEDYTLKVKVSTKAGETTMDDDGLHVLRIRNGVSGLRMTFRASKAGLPDVVRTFDLSGLTLKKA